MEQLEWGRRGIGCEKRDGTLRPSRRSEYSDRAVIAKSGDRGQLGSAGPRARPMLLVANRLASGLPIICYAAVFPCAAGNTDTPSADLSRQVQSLLSERCVSCHNASFQTANLRLDQEKAAFKGGDSGPVILPGNAADSLLIWRISGSELGLRMPPTGALPSREIELLRTWIDHGADWPDEPLAEERPAGTRRGQSGTQQELFAAIRRNDSSQVSRLLALDIDVNAADQLGETLLMHAALHVGPEVMRWLLDRGADPNLANHAGATPLMRATADLRKVRLLIEAGVRVDHQSQLGRTALLIAARRPGAGQIVKELLAAGADPNVEDERGVTPLMEAARAGDVASLRILIGAGVEINQTRNNGRTALIAAVRSREQEAVQLLLDHGADVNIQALEGVSSNSEDTALTMAAARGVPGIVRALIEQGADIEVRNAIGYTPLMQAACSDYVDAETVGILLEAGADIGPRGLDGETALSLARKRGNTAIVQLLLETERGPE